MNGLDKGAVRALMLAVSTLVLLVGGCASQGSISSNNSAELRARSRIDLASAYLAQGAPDIALQESRKAVEAAPELSNAHHVLALSYAALGDSASAVQSYKQAIRLDPSNFDAKSNFGMLLCEQGNATQAVQLITEGLSQPLYPRKPKLMQMAGFCLQSAGRLDEAVGWYDKAVQAEPWNTFSVQQLFDGLLAANRTAEAKAVLESVRKDNTDTPRVLWMLARLEKKAGSPVAAGQAVSDLMKRFPDSAEAQLAKTGKI